MSGLEPLAALGLACNVMQLIDFARETTSMCKTIYETGTPDPGLVSTIGHMTRAFENLSNSLDSARGSADPDEQALLEVARDCQAVARKLKAKVDKISKNTSGGKYFGAIMVASKASYRKRDIEKLEKSLTDHQRALETRLLGQIYMKNKSALTRSEIADIADDALRRFVEALTQGQTQMEQLLSKESASIIAVVSAEAAKTREVLGSTTAHERLLRSLKYETMNERRNQIADSHNRTCEWIFGDKSKESTPTSPRDKKSRSDFPEFLQSPTEKLFWISGKPGSGKSTLVKFLAENSRARDAIQATIPGASILSHFLWMAAQPMQRSIKGILCNLLYQYIQDDAELSVTILQRFLDVKFKEFLSDWSNQGLEDALFFALQSSSRGACIFLDGLDEIDPTDGQCTLLGLVDRLCGLDRPYLKVCVSSRPEAVLRKHLTKFRMLRVQDLTRSDIRNYVTDELQKYIQPTDPLYNFSYIVESLCRKADGVFLWVSLALKSIVRGWSSDDSPVELMKRLEALPGDLQQLYQEMWKRLNDDKQIYSQDAAFFLHCVLEFSDYGIFRRRSLTILHVTMALDPLLADSIIKDNTSADPEEFFNRCKTMATRLETRCAGLLEVSSETAVVAFIHRSAKEFLENTPEGQSILQHVGKETSEERLFNLIKADIALTRILASPSSSRYAKGWVLGTYAPNVVWCICHTHLLHHNSQLSTKDTMEAMWLYKVVYEAGGWTSAALSGRYEPDFLSLTSRVGFAEFNSVAIERLRSSSPFGKLSASYKSRLFYWATKFPLYKPFWPRTLLENIEWLLKEDIDPISPMFKEIRSDSEAEEYFIPGTPILNILLSAVTMRTCMDSTVPRCINELLRRGGRLTDTIFIVLRFRNHRLVLSEGRVPSWITSPVFYRLPYRTGKEVFIRASVSFLAKIYLNAVARPHIHSAAEGVSDLAEKVLSVPASATIFALKVPKDESGAQCQYRIPRNRTNIESLADNIIMNLDLGCLDLSPGFLELINDVAGHSHPITSEKFMEDLVAEGLLFRRQDIREEDIYGAREGRIALDVQREQEELPAIQASSLSFSN